MAGPHRQTLRARPDRRDTTAAAPRSATGPGRRPWSPPRRASRTVPTGFAAATSPPSRTQNIHTPSKSLVPRRSHRPRCAHPVARPARPSSGPTTTPPAGTAWSTDHRPGGSRALRRAPAAYQSSTAMAVDDIGLSSGDNGVATQRSMDRAAGGRRSQHRERR